MKKAAIILAVLASLAASTYGAHKLVVWWSELEDSEPYQDDHSE